MSGSNNRQITDRRRDSGHQISPHQPYVCEHLRLMIAVGNCKNCIIGGVL